VQTTLGRLLPVAEAAGVQLRSEVQAGTTVLLSAERADLLVSNLVMNAIQHSSIGMTVEIDVVKTEQSVVLRVADTGHGIQASALPHVFERFYREDVSRSRQTGGVGLGLSICKAIVDTAGGTIIMKSKPEEGTEVRVLLKRT
jgi:signal transduction histidine kinase